MMPRTKFLSSLFDLLFSATATPTPDRCPNCKQIAVPLRVDSGGRVLPGWTGAILSNGTIKAGIGRCPSCNAAFWQDARPPAPGWRRAQ